MLEQLWIIESIEIKFKKCILLPKGTIKRLTGKEISYDDEPYKIIGL